MKLAAAMRAILKRTRYIQLNSIDEVYRERVAIQIPDKAFISKTVETSIEDDIKSTFRLSLCVRVNHSNLRTEDSVRNEAIRKINHLLYGEFMHDLISLRHLIQGDKNEAIKLLGEMIEQLHD